MTNTDYRFVDAFLEPVNARHRQNEALGAFLIDKIPGQGPLPGSTTPRGASACCVISSVRTQSTVLLG
jgi:hypothetical protein